MTSAVDDNPRRITYDWSGPPDFSPPGPGDYLVCLSRRTSRPTGTCYSILSARVVRSKVVAPWVTRMAYVVVRVPLDEVRPRRERRSPGRAPCLVSTKGPTVTFYPSCPDCGAELQDINGVFRCPWFNAPGLPMSRVASAAILACGKPKKKVTFTFDTSKQRFR